MNYIDIAFAVALIVMAYAGVKRGLALSLLDMLKFFICIPLSYFFSRNYYQQVYSGFVQQKINEAVLQKINESKSIDAFTADIKSAADSLPVLIRENIDMPALGSLSAAETAEIVTNKMIEPIALTVIKIVLFVSAFIVLSLLFGLFIELIKKIKNSKHAPFKRTDSFLGGVFGAVKAVVLIFTVCVIFEYIIEISPQNSSGEFLNQLRNSAVIEYVNDFTGGIL